MKTEETDGNGAATLARAGIERMGTEWTRLRMASPWQDGAADAGVKRRHAYAAPKRPPPGFARTRSRGKRKRAEWRGEEKRDLQKKCRKKN